MIITYLGHSGFLLELKTIYCLFDYYSGQIPKLNPDKDLYIFVSHAHHDHYNRDIWLIRKSHPAVKYIVSQDVPLSAGQKQKLGLSNIDDKIIWRVKADESHQLSSELWVKTLLSTDEGVAFIVNYNKQTIFHAGDLNLWTWTGDDQEINAGRLSRFMAEMEKIRGETFDAAFFPLDPRQDVTCGDGLRIFNQISKTKILIPMHFWDKFAVINDYIKKYPLETNNILKLEYNGQVIKINDA